jgi:hypothetical protein
VRPRSSLGALVFALALAACLLTSTGILAAEPKGPPPSAAEAAQAFVEGQRAFEAGDYRRAATAFEAAYARKPHHAPLWNAARSWHYAGDDVRAANLLERYLAEAPAEAPDRPPANAALEEIKPHVGRVQLRAGAGMALRLDSAPVEPGVIYVAPGDHVVVGQADGRTVRRAFSVAGGGVVSVSLDPPEKVERLTPEEPPRGTRRLLPWTVLVGSALVVGGAGLTTWSGLDTVDRRDTFLEDRSSQARLDDAFASQTRTNVLLATTVVFAVATGALAAFFVDWRRPATAPRTGGR